VITLHTFGPAFGLPDPSPFVTKVEVLLKMAGLPYRTDTTGLRGAPKGKLPYIDDDGERVADSTFIRWHLENKYRIDFEKGLSPEQRAIAWAFEKMAEAIFILLSSMLAGLIMRISPKVRGSSSGKSLRRCVHS